MLGAPFDVDLAVGTVSQPDVLVGRLPDFGSRSLDTVPRLAVEVLSPSTRRYDLHLKRAVFEEAGCPSYWVADTDEPGLTVWVLADGVYGTPRRWVGDEPAHLAAPFEVTITPSRLVGPVRRA